MGKKIIIYTFFLHPFAGPLGPRHPHGFDFTMPLVVHLNPSRFLPSCGIQGHSLLLLVPFSFPTQGGMNVQGLVGIALTSASQPARTRREGGWLSSR